MTDFLDVALHELERLRRMAEKAMVQLDDDAFFHAPAEADNSVAVMVKHMAGNMRSRWRDFLTSDGEKPDRDRDGEFEVGEADTRAVLMRAWEEGWELCLGAIRALTFDDLPRSVRIRGETLSVMEAIQRQETHYAYHVGQLVFLARQQLGPRWQTLSVPKRGSAQFNQAPQAYRKGS